MATIWLLLTAACLTGADGAPATASAAPAPASAAPTNAVPPGIPAGCGGPSFGYCEPCYYCKPKFRDRIKAFLKPSVVCDPDDGTSGPAVICRPTLRDRVDAFHHALGTSPYTASPGGLCSPCSANCGTAATNQASK